VPVLAAESQIYPADLFVRSSNEEEKWWVLHTKSRCEKSLARTLEREGISFFLPLGQSKRRHQRRLVTSHVPLFPGYLFLRGDDQSRIVALQTNKVATTLDVEDQEQLEGELSALFRVVCSGEEVKAEPSLHTGDRIEVIYGVLAGLRGVIVRNDGQSRIFIDVKMLGRGVSVQVEDWMIQKI
jgi:transcription antitermination factor NusG